MWAWTAFHAHAKNSPMSLECGSKKFPLISVKSLGNCCLTWLPLWSLCAAGGGAEPAGGGCGGENGQSKPKPGAGETGLLWDGLSVQSLFPRFPPPAMLGGVPSIASCHWSQEDADELCELAEVSSRPSHHHGNGPYNDVNIPGCWFFKLPHKAS